MYIYIYIYICVGGEPEAFADGMVTIIAIINVIGIISMYY